MSCDEEEETAIVIDNGTSVLRAGYCGDDQPKITWPNLLARPNSEEQMLAMGLKDQYIGEEAQRERGRLSLTYPMERGVVRDWEAMEQVWQASFHQLQADPTRLPVMTSDRPLTPFAHRERMVQTMFETCSVPRFYVMSQGVLAAFASGRGTALIVDCGEGATTVMPLEGLNIRPHAILKGDVAGGDLTSYLHRLMTERHYDVMGQAGLEAVREVKESLCYVAQDYEAELKKAQSTSSLEARYELPDGQVITLSDERFRVPEALFQPYLIGKEGEGVHELVYNSIMKCDMDSRADFYVNIIPCGGSTCFPGFTDRLQKELTALLPGTRRVKVVTRTSMERKDMVWVGGSIIGSLSMFQNMWITREQYDEHGPSVVHQKCT